MRITVIGIGYLGAVHAACMANLGHEVLGIDAGMAKIEALTDGQPPFHEPGLGTSSPAMWKLAASGSPCRLWRLVSSAMCTSSVWARHRSQVRTRRT